MSTIISEIEAEQLRDVVPEFSAGDTVVVRVKVKEGSFTVRKISHGEGVERVFQTHSPQIEDVKVKRRGAVRRAKLYYLRGRSGNAAKIREKI